MTFYDPSNSTIFPGLFIKRHSQIPRVFRFFYDHANPALKKTRETKLKTHFVVKSALVNSRLVDTEFRITLILFVLIKCKL